MFFLLVRLNLSNPTHANITHPTYTHVGQPTLACIYPAVSALQEAKLHRKVQLIISGGVRNGAEEDGNSEGKPKRVVFVFFVGGVTFLEIAALRLVGRRKGVHLLIGASRVTSGSGQEGEARTAQGTRSRCPSPRPGVARWS